MAVTGAEASPPFCVPRPTEELPARLTHKFSHTLVPTRLDKKLQLEQTGKWQGILREGAADMCFLTACCGRGGHREAHPSVT